MISMREVFLRFLSCRLVFMCFATVILIAAHSVTRAQEPPAFVGVSCTVGPKYAVVDAMEKFYFSSGNEMVSVKIHEGQVNIQKYDATTLQLLSSEAAEGLPKGSEFEGFLELPGKLLFFYAVWESEIDTVKLYSREVDFSKGNLSSEAQYYVTVSYQITGTHRKHNMYPIGSGANDFFDIYLSPDSTKLLIQYGIGAAKKGEKKNLQVSGMAVFDFAGGLKLLWNREALWPFDVYRIVNREYTVDNDGNVFSVAWPIYDEKELKQFKEQGKEFFSELFILKETATPSSNPVMTKIDITGKRASDAYIRAAADGRIVLSGYYLYPDAADFYFDDVHGVFNCIIGKDGAVEQRVFEDIPADMSDLYYDKKSRKTGKPTPPGLGRLNKKKFNLYSDGSKLLFGEQYFEQVIEHNNPNYSSSSRIPSSPTTESTEYRFRNIIVTRFDQDGKLAWLNKLKKFQRAGRGCYSVSYRMIETEKEIYFFYLDNLKNLLPESDQNEPYLDSRAGYLAVYRMDKLTGDNVKIPLFDFGNVNGIKLHQVAPFRIVQSGPDEFVMEAYTGEKQDVLVKFKVPAR